MHTDNLPTMNHATDTGLRAVRHARGWWAGDSNAAVHYPDAKSAGEAAREYADDGWGEIAETTWIHVWTWTQDEGGEQHDREYHVVEIDPEEPDCVEDELHEWTDEAVRGHGGGVLISDVCAHCGLTRTIDTWAQDRETGQQGLRSISYAPGDPPGRDDDDDGEITWSRESALERTPRGTYEWVPEWDRGTTTEEDALCARAQEWLDEHLPASVEVRVRRPKKGEARGIYKRTGGELRILGCTIPVPPALDEALARAWEQARWPEEVR